VEALEVKFSRIVGSRVQSRKMEGSWIMIDRLHDMKCIVGPLAFLNSSYSDPFAPVIVSSPGNVIHITAERNESRDILDLQNEYALLRSDLYHPLRAKGRRDRGHRS
jgi:hypothetical protein